MRSLDAAPGSETTMKATTWNVPIRARTYRSNELVRIEYRTGGISVHLDEEDSEHRWELSFTGVQALRVTTWESAHEILRRLPDEAGGFFELFDSELSRALGAGRLDYMRASRHFVLCCYDEVVEVVAHHVALARLSSNRE